MKKKQWQKPELVVLVRNKPQEAVLSTCKVGVGGPAGPSTNKTNCLNYDCWDLCYEETGT
jgi:hypothetical protein